MKEVKKSNIILEKPNAKEVKYEELIILIIIFINTNIKKVNNSSNIKKKGAYLNYAKNDMINAIKEIRIEIGHEDIDIHINNIIWENKNIWIITPDRSNKSAIIGKGGWVVGKLREKMGFNQVHVEAESDCMIKRFKMELAFERINEVLAKIYNSDTYNGLAKPLENLESLLEKRMTNIYNFSFIGYINEIKDSNNNGETNNGIINDTNNYNVKTIVALSGGVDSSYSLIVSKYLGFNPIAITVDPGTIVLPKHLKLNIENLCSKLNVEHHYIGLDYTDIINNSLAGNYHPCGRCSKEIDNALLTYAIENKANFIIFGDMLTTGYQSIVEISNNNNINNESNNNKIMKINLPAFLAIGKLEIKELTKEFGVKKVPGFGCPLLHEVQKKHPHMRKFSIQRVLRETRSGALELGEALDLIWSFVK